MLIKQSETTASRRTVFFTAVNTADDSAHTSTIAGSDIKLSKAGGAEASATNSATHISTGLHKLELTAAECDTLGELSVRLNKTGVYNDVRVLNIVAFDPYSGSSLGLSNLDTTVSGGSAASVVTAMLAETIDGQTIETILAIAGAVGAAKRSISGGTFILRDLADTKNLVAATVDGNGNVTSTTIG